MHISAEKAQHLPQMVDRDVFLILTSADMRQTEPPTVSGLAR
jgi:hypothetical protein